ncbi:hypothetical protein M9H77_21343 [Catharanthus roseus]|uniref:Uncharacterized protein n=1 Tax=Catharanthus roseus TaxID=4058 RepID=A0ACC0AMB3_CATRO|nr:hypothetical protein M9H77_21343 [Catharanthus roseus]
MPFQMQNLWTLGILAQLEANYIQIFPTCSLVTTSVSHSDHLALILYLESCIDVSLRNFHRIKRFEPHWTKDEDCVGIFEKLWLPDPRPSVDSIRSNIGTILEHLLECNKKKFGDIPTCIQKARHLLDELRIGTDWYPKDEAKLELELNKILALEKTTGKQDLEQTGTPLISIQRLHEETPKELLKMKIFTVLIGLYLFYRKEVDTLIQPFTPAKVLTALKHIKGQKSPEPNGLQACFLQTYWHIVVIINRLRKCMTSIIHNSQSAFVENRLITDNFVISFEAFHSIQNGKINNSNHFALKLHLSIAFDRVQLNYLEAIMIATHACTSSSGLQFTNSCPSITHLFFANDNVTFRKATPQNAEAIKKVLEDYTALSGQEEISVLLTGPKAIFLWCSLLEGRNLLSLGLRHHINNGLSTNISYDKWIPTLKKLIPSPYHLSRGPEKMVSDLIDYNQCCWREDMKSGYKIGMEFINNNTSGQGTSSAEAKGKTWNLIHNLQHSMEELAFFGTIGWLIWYAKNKHKIGIGITIRIHTGILLLAKSISRKNSCSVEFDKLLVIIECYISGLNYNERLLIESNSLLAINSFNNLFIEIFELGA